MIEAHLLELTVWLCVNDPMKKTSNTTLCIGWLLCGVEEAAMIVSDPVLISEGPVLCVCVTIIVCVWLIDPMTSYCVLIVLLLCGCIVLLQW